MKTYRLSTRIDEETRRKLEDRAGAEAVDESAIVRAALDAYLSQKEESAYEAFQRAGGLGIAKGTPPDLSTNKKYLEGFGRSENPRSRRHRSTRRASRV